MKNNRLFAALALAALLLPTAGFAASSEAELMKQAKITKAEAEKIALAKVPEGKIQSAEIENEHHALVWSFDIVKPGSKDITEVLVNAKTGKIVSVDTENPTAQAKERAEDKAAAKP
ncbi:MAG: PepSY domain-containing protein [Chthoniobacterales bacterium]